MDFLFPGNKISGGRVLSSRTPFVINRIATLLRTLAMNIVRTDILTRLRWASVSAN